MKNEKEEQQEEVQQSKKVYDFNKLQDRRSYIQDHPELFPEKIQKFLLQHEPYKDGISWFAYHLAQDVTTRHEAHWQLQSFLLLEIWGLLKEFLGKSERKGPEEAVVRRRR